MGEIIYKNSYPQDSWEARLETLILVGRGMLKYPRYIEEVSVIIGGLRDKANASLNAAGVRDNRRAEDTVSQNVVGVRAELIAHHLLHTKGIRGKTASLLSDGPVSVPDIIASGCRIDVKGIRPDGWDLMINTEYYPAKKKLTHYLFVQGVDGVAQYWIYPHDDIAGWTTKKVGYTVAYYKPIKEVACKVDGSELPNKTPEPAPEVERSENRDLFI